MSPRAYGHALFALLGIGAADVVTLNSWAVPAALAMRAADAPAATEESEPKPARTDEGAEGAGGSAAAETDISAATQPAEPAAVVDRPRGEQPSDGEPKLERDPALVLFHKGTWWIGPMSRRAIRGSLERVRPSRIVELEGHADPSGTHEINQRISEQRALAVESYLVGAGIEPERIRVRAFGETKANGTALDRRVEIWIEP